MSPPRHARVLPSFAVKHVANDLKVDIGRVSKEELLAWRGSALPSATTAAALREQFVFRRRSSFDALWKEVVNIKMTNDWGLCLTDEEMVRAKRLQGQDLASLTLREVKEHLNLKVSSVLGILAKLEAVYWDSNVPERSVPAMQPASSIVRASPEFVAELRHCLSMPWVSALAPDDLRFPSSGRESVLSWAEKQASLASFTADAHEYCNRLVSANRATWRQELEDVMREVIPLVYRRNVRPEERERWLSVGIMRFSGPDVTGYQELGAAHGGVTRQRAQQMYERIELALRSRSVAVPALSKLLEAAARVMPLDLDEADRQLARLLGEGPGLRSALAFAEIIGLESPVQKSNRNLRTRDGSVKRVKFLERAREPVAWVPAALALARRDCTFVGCSSFIRIAGLLALDHGVSVDSESLQSILSQAPGFEILDREKYWFTQKDSDVSVAATRVKKLMAISPTTDVDTVATVLVTDDRWLEGSRAHALPPLHILTAMIATWEWAVVDGHNKFRLREVLDPAAVLSESELLIVEAIRDLGGAATRAELVSMLTARIEITHHAISFMLARSPIIRKLEHGLYALQSQHIEAQGLIDARKRRVIELSKAGDAVPVNVDLSRPVRVPVNQTRSEIAIRRRVVYVPSHLGPKLQGQYTDAHGQLPSIAVKSNSQVRWLSWAATQAGVAAGQRFEVVFDLLTRTYELDPSRRTPVPEQGDATVD